MPQMLQKHLLFSLLAFRMMFLVSAASMRPLRNRGSSTELMALLFSSKFMFKALKSLNIS